ncbi:MAG: IS21 family transposase [Elusimicrobia bacterium]|nr:IS21 family transposase [Elusimicrobiota bacterium]
MDSDLWATIRRLFEVDKLSRANIARKLHLDRKTVRRALAFKDAPPPRVVVVRSSKIHPFATYLSHRIKEYPDLSAVKLLTELRGMGYPGGLSILKNHLRELRPKTQDVFLRIETLPGEQAQVDWANCGSLRVGAALRKLSCFVMVLSYSRMIYLEFTLSQSLEDFLACHVHAFRFFGGIPKKILYDNLKTVVLSRMGRDIRFHPRFMDFAGAHLFEPVPCNVRAGWEKGKVESGIRYIRISFLAGRPITSWPLLARDADIWRDTVANVRTHGTTAEKPMDRFPADHAALRPLPPRDYDTSIVRPVKATRQAFVLFDANAYSVPAALTGKPLTLKADPHHVRIFNGQDLVSEHLRSYEKNLAIECPEHRKGILATKRKAAASKTADAFLALGPVAEDYLAGLASAELHIAHHLTKIMDMVGLYGNTELLQALTHALAHKAFGAPYIQNIVLQQRARRGLSDAPPLVLPDKPQWTKITVEEQDLALYDDLFPGDPNDSNLP